ncbi:hypothetical protein AX14_010273 [Amanita brunnescens Koide BX004]|nr:hypothetical protein AX14_010273 [Amanita brunnescens Koide BX004]
MDPNNLSPPTQSETVMRHLPAYEEINMPYSFRLPTYRSSYIRRFHPYARYVSLSIKEYDMDDSEFRGDQAPYILGERALQHDTTPAAPTVKCVDE